MRRIILTLILGICAMGAFAYNESVAAISYNPSRLGVYNTLKVVSTATLAGGLELDDDAEMHIRATDTVVLLDENRTAHTCTADSCAYREGVGDEGSLNTIEVIRQKADGVAKAITQARMQGMGPDTFNLESYSIDDGTQPASSQGTDISMLGGVLSVTSSAYVGSLTVNEPNTTPSRDKPIWLDTSVLNVKNLHHVGSKTLSPTDSEAYFQLGKITIKPTKCTTGCKSYDWLDVTDSISGANVKVLAVKVN